MEMGVATTISRHQSIGLKNIKLTGAQQRIPTEFKSKTMNERTKDHEIHTVYTKYNMFKTILAFLPIQNENMRKLSN